MQKNYVYFAKHLEYFQKKGSFLGISLWERIFSSGPIKFWNQQLKGFQKSIGFPMLSPKSDHI